MANVFNATTTTGLQLTPDNSGAVTFESAGGASPLAFNVTGTVAMSSSFMRNRIINGAMQIAQRGTSFSSPANGVYTLDRWVINWTGAAPATVAQVGGPTGYPYAIRVTGGASNTATNLSQKIESFNIADLAGTTVTLSVTMQASSAQPVAWQVSYPNSVDNYTSTTLIANGTFSVTTTATQFTTQISLPSNAANGLWVIFSLNNGGAFTSGTLTITGVQLEAGSVATPFEFKSIGDMLVLCQRYFETSYNLGTAPGSATATGMGMSYVSGPTGFNAGGIYFQFKVPKRTTPTMVSYSPASGSSGYMRDAVNNADVSASWAIGGNSGAFVQAVMSASSNYVNFQAQYTASAEL